MSQLLGHSIEKNDRTEDVIIKETTTFESLLLQDKVLKGLKKNGFLKPSPIQLKTIPVGRCGFDLMVKSKSGTGKTLIFTIIALENVDAKKEAVQVLIIAPAREISVQIQEVISQIGCFIEGLKVQSFIGGLSFADDIEKCRNCHIAVGTPGRLKHLIKENLLKLESVRLFILDEVDKLTESTFINDINEIYNCLPAKKQIITTSATYPQSLEEFLSQYMLSPTFVTSEIKSPLLLGLKQFVKMIEPQSNVVQQMRTKNDVLHDILSRISFTQCLVFSNYQNRAESISNFLNQKGWMSTFISAAQSQNDRLTALNNLKEFKCRILLSTDLTARGIDAANVDLVINYDIPNDAMTYLHRMGRAGRFGSSGVCINLAFEDKELVRVQHILGCIGGAELNIPVLPEFTGSLSDLLKVEIAQDQHIKAVVSDAIKDMRGEILELKANKFGCNNSKSDKNKKSKVTTKYKKEDVLNILDDKSDVEKIKEQISDMDTNDILESLASGTFDFGSNDVKKDQITPSYYPEDNKENSSQIEHLKKLLTTAVGQNNVESGDSKSKSPPRDKKQDLFCKNKALYSIAKALDAQNTDKEEEGCISEYLNLMKQQEKSQVSNIANNYIPQVLGNELDLGSLENAAMEALNISQDSEDKPKEKESTSKMSISDISVVSDKDGHKKYDVENIFQLGYESIVKSDGKSWESWVSTRRNSPTETTNNNAEDEDNNTEDDEYQGDVDTAMEQEEVEIMKWVPVNPTKKAIHTVSLQEGENSSESCSNWMSTTKCVNVPVQPACMVETNTVDNYQHYYGYYDNCNKNLWENGLSFEGVEQFDEWFAYEWEAQLHSIRNYVQQNIYVQEMSRFQNHYGSGST